VAARGAKVSQNQRRAIANNLRQRREAGRRAHLVGTAARRHLPLHPAPRPTPATSTSPPRRLHRLPAASAPPHLSSRWPHKNLRQKRGAGRRVCRAICPHAINVNFTKNKKLAKNLTSPPRGVCPGTPTLRPRQHLRLSRVPPRIITNLVVPAYVPPATPVIPLQTRIGHVEFCSSVRFDAADSSARPSGAAAVLTSCFGRPRVIPCPTLSYAGFFAHDFTFVCSASRLNLDYCRALVPAFASDIARASAPSPLCCHPQVGAPYFTAFASLHACHVLPPRLGTTTQSAAQPAGVL
jgi:hypothetical protein